LGTVESRWFPARTTAASSPQPIRPALAESKENFARVLSMLDAVSSDTTYGIWRDIVWSLASTGWAIARQIAHTWSQMAPDRYDGAALDKLFNTFDPSKLITLGTLVHHARNNGWSGNAPATTMALPPLPAPTTQPTLPLLMTADQLRQIPATPYVVRGVLPAQGLAAIYGAPGSGKTFLALHLAYGIAASAPDWFGFPIIKAPVVYVALEGQGGIVRRVTALELHSNQLCPDLLRFWRKDIQLLTGDGIVMLASEIAASVGTGAVVIIDTLNQASPGADENASQDMGKIIASAKHLAAAVGGLVVLVHHAGKDHSRGLRGHSSLFAAMDAVIEVRKTAAGHEWWLTKAKDDESGISRNFDLAPYTVGTDAFGPLTSCAVQPAIHARSPPKHPATGKHQKAALEELRRLLSAQGDKLDYQSALTNVATVIDCPAPRAPDRAKEAVDGLIRGGHLFLNEGNICLT
jgi:hypothetical protein